MWYFRIHGESIYLFNVAVNKYVVFLINVVLKMLSHMVPLKTTLLFVLVGICRRRRITNNNDGK